MVLLSLCLKGSEGPPFLKMGVIFASSHIKGNLPEVREKYYIYRLCHYEAHRIYLASPQIPKMYSLSVVIHSQTSLFLGFNLSITNGIVSSKIYDKRDGFYFGKSKFPIS